MQSRFFARAILCILALTLGFAGMAQVRADDPTTDAVIGENFVLRFSGAIPPNPPGQGNLEVDGTIIATAFGGPCQIPPPGPVQVPDGQGGTTTIDFSQSFQVNGNGDYVPASVSPNGLMLPGAFEDVIQDAWVYAYVMVNNAGDNDPNEGGALITRLQIGLSFGLSQLATVNGRPAVIDTNGGNPGQYIYAYGQTNEGGPIKTASTVNIPAGSGSIDVPYESPTFLQPGDRAEVVFYYSPFAPSNANASVQGRFNSIQMSKDTDSILPTARFFPEFSCEFQSVPAELEPGDMATLDYKVTNTTRGPGAPFAEPPGRQPTDPFREFKDINGDYPADFVRVTVTEVGPNPCFSIMEVGMSGGANTTDAKIMRGTTDDLPVDIVVDNEACNDGCTSLDINAQLEALSPYDDDPPFEGNPDPTIDADPNGAMACEASIGVECPCIFEFYKRVDFLPEGQNPDCTPSLVDQGTDAPICGLVVTRLTVKNTDGSSEAINITKLEDTLPAGLTFVEVLTPNVNANFAGGKYTFTGSGVTNPINPGDTRVICFTARVDSNASGTITNTACAMADCASGGSAQPEAGITKMVDINILAPELDVTVQQQPGLICPQQNSTVIVFKVENKNTATWPLSLNINQATVGCLNLDSQVVAPNVTELAPGEMVTVTVTVSQGTCGTQLVPVKLVVDSMPTQVGNRCPDQDDAEVDVQTVDPGIQISCVANPQPVVGGDMVTFSIKVTNTGSAEIQNLALDPGYTLDPGLTFDSEGPFQPGTTIGPGEMATVVVTAIADDDIVPGAYCLRNIMVTGHPTLLGANGICDVADDIEQCCTLVLPDVDIPTLTEIGMMLLVLAMGGVMILSRRRG